MSFLNRLLGIDRDPREELRPLWRRVVEISRRPHWYAQGRVADTVAGRFDMIVAILALVLLRMERDPALAPAAAHLTELFVEDMDGQLRESGVGDLAVGKQIGKLMSVLGGRLGAFRDGLASTAGGELTHAVARNITLADGADPALAAGMLRDIHRVLDNLPVVDLLEGRVPA